MEDKVLNRVINLLSLHNGGCIGDYGPDSQLEQFPLTK